jgi:hypothetical protein
MARARSNLWRKSFLLCTRGGIPVATALSHGDRPAAKRTGNTGIVPEILADGQKFPIQKNYNALIFKYFHLAWRLHWTLTEEIPFTGRARAAGRQGV